MQSDSLNPDSQVDAKTVFVYIVAIIIFSICLILETYAQLGLFAITSGRKTRTWHHHRQQNRAVVRASAQTLSDMELSAYDRHAPSEATVEPQLDVIALARAENDGVEEGDTDPIEDIEAELEAWFDEYRAVDLGDWDINPNTLQVFKSHKAIKNAYKRAIAALDPRCICRDPYLWD
jgi:hypothetical protein